MRNKIKIILGIFVVLTMLLPSLFAFGVSSGYYEGKPLVMHQGETTTVKLVLQNMGGSDEEVKAELTSGEEIANLEETNYVVKRGTADTLVPIKITSPSDVPINTTYRVSVSFKTLAPGGNGVTMGVAISNGFDVLVIGKEKKPINFLVYIVIVAIIAVIIIAYFVIKKSLRNRRISG